MGGNTGEIQIGSGRELYKYINHQAGTTKANTITIELLVHMIPSKRFDIFSSLTGGYSEGLGAFWFFFKHDNKLRMRAQDQCFVRSVLLHAHDFG